MQLIKGGFSYRAKKELGYPGEVWQPAFQKFESSTGRVSWSIANTSTKTQSRRVCRLSGEVSVWLGIFQISKAHRG